MVDSKYVNIGECAGNFQLISRALFDEVYNELKVMLDSEGNEAVLNYSRRCWRHELDVTPMREALIKTIVHELPNEEIRLNTSDEINENFGKS